MLEQRIGRNNRSLLTLALVSALLLAARPASAFFDEQHGLLPQTAATLDGGEFLIGVWDVGVGVTDWLMLDTYTLPWILKVYNGWGKVRLQFHEDWAGAVKLGLFRFDLRDVDKDADPVVLKVIPLEGTVTHRLTNRLSVSVGAVYTHVAGQASHGKVRGAAGHSNFQLTTALEYRLSKRWAAVLRTRHLLYLDVSAKVEIEQKLDEFTTVEWHISGGSDDLLAMGFPQTYQVLPLIAYSSSWFNFELGVSLGNYNISGVNLMFPGWLVIPHGDLYFRF